MPRQLFEFNCSTECGATFDFKLNISLSGNYRIHCPKCKHIHYRKLVNGKITEDRFDKDPNSIIVEDIRPMLSSIRSTSKEVPDDLSENDSGFMRRLWSEKFSAKVTR